MYVAYGLVPLREVQGKGGALGQLGVGHTLVVLGRIRMHRDVCLSLLLS